MSDKVQLVRNAMLAVQRYPWEQGVCAQALWELGDETTAVAMAHDAMLRAKEDGRLAVINENIAVTDPAANGEVVWRAYELIGDLRYRDSAEKLLHYLMKQAPRTERNIICHNEVSFHEGYSKDQIWADSIYMAPPFLAIMGETEEAVFQIEGYIEYLREEETGLLYHIYDAGTGRFVRKKLWATGNGWALLGIARVVETAYEQNRPDLAERLLGLGRVLLDAMLGFQLADGRFHDILDDGNSFVEGTAAMMMATFIYRGVAGGWLSNQYIEKAEVVRETMEGYVDEFGLIQEVCGCPDFQTVGTSAESMASYLMMHAWYSKLYLQRMGRYNKIAGCMMGGAVGDALGYAVEFDSYDSILSRYGKKGITQYDLNRDGIAVISDDTQMSLFTANGILVGYTRAQLRGIMGPIESYVHLAYKDWLITQQKGKKPEQRHTWLMDIPQLYARRAPGNTCLSALQAKEYGTIENPINDSKGCGGIMRVAPLALLRKCEGESLNQLALEGAKIAALTHGHPLGYMSAAVLVYILNRLVYSPEGNLENIVRESKGMLKDNFTGTPHLEELMDLIDKSICLANNESSDIENIRMLGEGWVAEETLAIALYCSLRYQKDFSDGVIASVNHDGDSDSSGAVTGNILGALLGSELIDERWKKNLELYDVIEEISMDLCCGCPGSEYSAYRDEEWVTKYVQCRRDV